LSITVLKIVFGEMGAFVQEDEGFQQEFKHAFKNFQYSEVLKACVRGPASPRTRLNRERAGFGKLN
jgi:hypothetical protein